jgi:hypothetical protein
VSGGHTRIGVDVRDGLVYTARVEHHPGRQEVLELACLEYGQVGDSRLLQEGEVLVSVPDELVLVKKVSVGAGNDFDTEARFELAQTLPEDEDQYFFDILGTGRDGRFLGLAVRRDRLDDYTSGLPGVSAGTNGPTGCIMRAAALAAGYVGFCRKSGGDLVCLADFVESAVSLAFLYQNATMDLCHLPLRKSDPNSSTGGEKLAIELKTLVNFKTASLFSEGITTPLSAMIVSGDGITDEVTNTLKKFFAIDIDRPAVNTGFFSSQADLASVPLEKYLVALGLAAN